MTSNELLQTVNQITQDNLSNVEKHVKKLSENQLQWRPNPGVWSVAEILAHLNQYALYYHQNFQAKIEGTRFTQPKETFVSSPLGKSAWKSMKLGNANNVKRKFKAPREYNPTLVPHLITGNEFHEFLQHQSELLEILDRAKSINLQRVKVAVSISKIIRLRLGDALLFVVYHNQRHIQQLMNLVKHANFPRK